jgi:hypothetical protein
MAPKARALLKAHRITGDTKIRVRHGKVDSFVVMEGVGAVSIEYGHGTYIGPRGYVGPSRGLYIMSTVAAQYGAR